MIADDDPVGIFLAHHGILGMHWGQHKAKEAPKGRSKGGSTGNTPHPQGLSEHEKAVRNAVGANEHTDDYLRARYAPEQKKKGLSGKEKAALIGGAAVGAIFLGSLASRRLSSLSLAKKEAEIIARNARFGGLADELNKPWVPPKATPFQTFMAKQKETKLDRSYEGWTKEHIAGLSNEGVKLEPGSVVKRVSTAKEEAIREGGFFATFKPEDTERYKAVLPTYWKQWGMDQKSGYVVSLKAKTHVSAPSEKEAYDLFKNSFDDEFIGMQGTKTTMRDVARIMHGGNTKGLSDEDLAAKAFPTFSAYWASLGAESENGPVAHYFKVVKAAGHNALIDTNDAGSIGEAPLRILDGTIFEIAGHETLSEDAIKAAQDAIIALAHMLRAAIGSFLAHRRK